MHRRKTVNRRRVNNKTTRRTRRNRLNKRTKKIRGGDDDDSIIRVHVKQKPCTIKWTNKDHPNFDNHLNKCDIDNMYNTQPQNDTQQQNDTQPQNGGVVVPRMPSQNNNSSDATYTHYTDLSRRYYTQHEKFYRRDIDKINGDHELVTYITFTINKTENAVNNFLNYIYVRDILRYRKMDVVGYYYYLFSKPIVLDPEIMKELLNPGSIPNNYFRTKMNNIPLYVDTGVFINQNKPLDIKNLAKFYIRAIIIDPTFNVGLNDQNGRNNKTFIYEDIEAENPEAYVDTDKNKIDHFQQYHNYNITDITLEKPREKDISPPNANILQTIATKTKNIGSAIKNAFTRSQPLIYKDTEDKSIKIEILGRFYVDEVKYNNEKNKISIILSTRYTYKQPTTPTTPTTPI